MKSVLHGSWIVDSTGQDEGIFFVWAERTAPMPSGSGSRHRTLRHPFAATALEIADLLSGYVPTENWRGSKRLTRVALLPSTSVAPIVPRWLLETEDDLVGADEDAVLRPWRTEGLGLPMLKMLDVLAALPFGNHDVAATQRLGSDLRYWGLVAKFGLELLAQQHYLPGMAGDQGKLYAEWQPYLESKEDTERLAALADGMPPASRAILRERVDIDGFEAAAPQLILRNFLGKLIDGAVRSWADPGAKVARARSRPSFSGFGRNGGQNMAQGWWLALKAEDSAVNVPQTKPRDVTRFYQAWQNWTYRVRPELGASFRICFRLEPPELSADRQKVIKKHWTLRYMLQAADDPSLLVPAREVWRERGEVLSYLNTRFDHPQERLLEGLGTAAEMCQPVRRSLIKETPELAVLSDQEAYTFLRETSRLLEHAGFGVMVPPWWNQPDTRLRLRTQMRTAVEPTGQGMLGLNTLVTYDWQLALGDEVLTREEFERLAALKAPLVQVRGRWVLLQPDQVDAAIAFWTKHRDQAQLPLADALGLALGAEPTLDGLDVGEVELDSHLDEMLGALTGEHHVEVLDPPQKLEGSLRPYQVLGYSWLMFLRKWGFGACLADDMGLGKTIQTIAAMLRTKAMDPDAAPALVICPTSLVGNWRREVERFAPSLRVHVHHGSGRKQGDQFLDTALANDLIISTYGLMRRDITDLGRVHWSMIALDEAQNIKNPVTKQSRAARRLKGDYRVALTGTPVENRLSELWSIMSFLNPGYLGPLEHFRRTFAMPIERFQDNEAADQLKRLVRPFILRRVKTDPDVIQDLPEKFEYKVFCNLTPEQGTLYEAVVQDAMQTIDDAAGGASIRRRGLVLAMLTRLKQICDHPALFLGDRSDIGRRSGKLNRLTEMLEEVLEVGDRALVFTQFAQMGFILQRHIQDTFGQEVLFLHGGTAQTARDRMLSRFQDDEDAPSVFVLSLKAGGTGLNLMRANHVFHFDRWWNPAVENQATDRAYRIGQTRDVQVHKYVSAGTLEERIDALIESKKALADNVVGNGEAWLTDLSTQDLRELIMLRAEAIEEQGE